MRTAALLIVFLVLAGVVGCQTNRADTCIVITPKGKVRVPAYYIESYKPEEGKYGCQVYNARAARTFLAAVSHKYSEDDIIAVDNLKWQLRNKVWQPYPNPPMPVYKAGDDRGIHCKRYAEWIDTHPHFGYPPLPMPNKN